MLRRARTQAPGQNHRDAVTLLETVEPNGPTMAKDLRRLLGRKDDVGLRTLAAAEERKMVEWAQRLLRNATATLEL